MAEFVAIFAGVTLSLAADDWRDRLADRAVERAGLELILEDLRADTVEIQSAIVYIRRHDEAALALLTYGEAPPSTDSLGMTVRRFLFGDAYQFQRSGFLSLRDADRLSLIQNEELRAGVIRYFEESQVKVDGYAKQHMVRREAVLESLIQHVDWPGPRTAASTWPLAAEPPAIRTSWAEMRSDAELDFRIMDVGALASITVLLATQLLDDNALLRAAIQTELESG